MALEQLGRFKLIEQIGKGSMGVVFRGQDTEFGRVVAIKVLSADMAAEEEGVARFRREAQAAAELDHPNIIQVYDYGEDQGHLFMAMELLQGRDLTDVIRDGQLSLSQKIHIMHQVCDGMAYVHEQEIVHRDLKPGNIHVQPDGHIKIMDFGLVRLGWSQMTAAGAVMGSPRYMSPEQMRGETVTVQSDVFSLGSVFYELMSGRLAFDSKQMHEIMFGVLTKEPIPLAEVAPDIPPKIVALVEKAHKKNLPERYKDAGEMRNELAVMLEAIRKPERPDPQPVSSLGRHLLGELVGCRNLPETPEELDPMLQRAADLIGATVVAKQFHRFEPWGLSGVMLVRESHISVHTWPEHRCACVDIFTCSEKMDPTPALDYLREAFGAEEIDVQEIQRGRRAVTAAKAKPTG